MQIDWKPELSVGVEFIDAEHQTILAVLDELQEAVSQGRGNPVLGEILSRMAEYTKSHCAHEEQAMRLHRYPRATEHVAQHAAMISEVDKIMTRQTAGDPALTVDAVSSLHTWLSCHIEGSDKKLGEWLVAQGRTEAPMGATTGRPGTAAGRPSTAAGRTAVPAPRPAGAAPASTPAVGN